MKTLLLVEDEEFAAKDLKDLLYGIDPTLEIRTARNASEALEAIDTTSYDAIFLDVELPGMSGIEMLRKLPGPLPPVVLVTAHALQALDAFGLGVSQCLLKPVDPNRLRNVYDRIAQAAQVVPVPPTPVVVAEEPREALPPREHMLFREGLQIHFVKRTSITRIHADGGMTRIFYPQGSVTLQKSLEELEDHFAADPFFRINDDNIVNLEKVDRFTSSATGQLTAHFSEGLELTFSLERSRLFEEIHGV